MQSVGLLPNADSAHRRKVLTLRHPRTAEEASFLVIGNAIFELLNSDRPHSSWFLKDSVMSAGGLLVAAQVHPLFLALPFLASRCKDAIAQADIFVGSPFEPIQSILLPYLGNVCVDSGNAFLTYDAARALDWVCAKADSLLDFFKRQSGVEDQQAIEMAFDVVRHFLERGFAAEVRRALALMYPCSFKPKAIAATDSTGAKGPKGRAARRKAAQKGT
jgi:hypothetical protein